MNKANKPTPGPWRYNGQDCIINPDISFGESRMMTRDSYEHYGGELVCESVNGPDGRLIEKLPAMLDLLGTIMQRCNEQRDGCPFCGVEHGNHEESELCSEIEAIIGNRK